MRNKCTVFAEVRKYKTRNAKCGMQNTKHETRNAKCGMQNAKCTNAKCKMQNAKCKMQNAKRRCEMQMQMQNTNAKCTCKMQDANAKCKFKYKCEIQMQNVNAKCKYKWQLAMEIPVAPTASPLHSWNTLRWQLPACAWQAGLDDLATQTGFSHGLRDRAAQDWKWKCNVVTPTTSKHKSRNQTIFIR